MAGSDPVEFFFQDSEKLTESVAVAAQRLIDRMIRLETTHDNVTLLFLSDSEVRRLRSGLKATLITDPGADDAMYRTLLSELDAVLEGLDAPP